MSWTTLGAIAPNDLAGARAETHRAAQILAAVGETHAAHAADTSHTAMRWDGAQQRLVGAAVEVDGAQRRVALAVPSLSLHVLDDRDALVAERGLAGLTPDEAEAWTMLGLVHHARIRKAKILGEEIPASLFEESDAAFERAVALAGPGGLADFERARLLSVWPGRADEAGEALQEVLR